MIRVYKVSYTDKYSEYAIQRGETGIREEFVYSEYYTNKDFECSDVMEQVVLDVEEVNGEKLYLHLLNHKPEWITELHVSTLTSELCKLNYLPKRIIFEGKNLYNDDYDLVFFNSDNQTYLTFSNHNLGEVTIHIGKDHFEYKTIQKYNGCLTEQLGRWMSSGGTTESSLDFYTISQIITRIKSCSFGN